VSDAEGVQAAGVPPAPDLPMEPFAVAYHGRSAFASESRPPMSTRYVPFVRSIKSYNGQRLRTDAVAGVTVAALALPSAMAFAEIAGVPVSAGLYALLVPVLAYAVFGSARRLVIGPEGTVSLLVASALAPLAATGSTDCARPSETPPCRATGAVLSWTSSSPRLGRSCAGLLSWWGRRTVGDLWTSIHDAVE